MQPILLGQLLLQREKLTSRDLDRALSAQKELGGLLGRVLVQLGVVSEIDVALALAQQLQLEYVSADHFPSSPPDIPGLLDDFSSGHSLYVMRVDGACAHVAMAVPQDGFAKKAFTLATGLAIRAYVATDSAIAHALAQQTQPDASVEDVADESQGSEFVEQLKDLASEAPVIRLVSSMISRVIELRASDIHLEPFDDGLHVRYRVDGTLQLGETIPEKLGAAVSSRVKLLAHLDIAERRLPQDGRIRLRVKGRELDLRVSTVPTVHGESVVMRVLDRSSVRFGLAEMGFAPDTLTAFEALLQRPHGILLVTGPTGSGKTTTLYAALSQLNATEQKVITVEDPVEYQLEGVNQIQVHAQIGLSFAGALRSILRQDPDIIMVGEMRDGETAQIAVQSALTGHLVLSTLHTNTAASAVVRLRDMGVESYLITSSVNGVLAQRLVRTLCNSCKESYIPTPAVLSATGLARVHPPGASLYKPRGCPECRGTGYRGRMAIHELLVIDESMRQAIISGADAEVLQASAVDRGMLSLYEDGLRKVSAGSTTLEEVARAAGNSDSE